VQLCLKAEGFFSLRLARFKFFHHHGEFIDNSLVLRFEFAKIAVFEKLKALRVRIIDAFVDFGYDSHV